MALLRRKSETPVATLERELSDLTSRRDVLDQKLAAAAGELAQAFDQRRQALLDLSDEVAAARRDAACRAAQDKHSSLVDALSAIGGKIADVQTLLIAARDRVEREELARVIQSDADALAAAAATFADAGAKIVPLMEGLAARLPGVALDFVPRVGMLVGELPIALNELISSARAFVAQMESGSAPLHRPAPPAPMPEPVPEIERLRIYTLANLKWCERGQVMTAPRYAWATPPRAVSETAIARNLADLPGHERTERLIAGFGVHNGPVPGDMCVDLDHIDAPAEQQPRALPPGFQERIGPVRQMQISVNRQ
jgi:hypothetical protein